MKYLHIFTRKTVFICVIAVLAVLLFLFAPKKHVVVCAGDSLTYGSGVGKENRETDSYPAQLQQLLGDDYRVINCGLRNATASFEGDLPYGNSKEFKRSLDDRAEIVILMLGANDTKTYNWNADNYRAGLENLVESYQKLPGSPYVVLGRPPYTYAVDGGEVAEYEIQPAVGRDEVGVIVGEVAQKYGIELVDLYEVTEGREELYTDGIHFKKEGYTLIRDTIYNSLLEQLN